MNDGQIICKLCGKRRVEEIRECWDEPACFACVPPAPSVDWKSIAEQTATVVGARYAAAINRAFVRPAPPATTEPETKDATCMVCKGLPCVGCGIRFSVPGELNGKGIGWLLEKSELEVLREIADAARQLLINWEHEDDGAIQTLLDVIEIDLTRAGR